jgi:hypothetical protein
MKKLTSPPELIKTSLKIFTKKENLIFLTRIYLPMGILTLISMLFVYIPFLSKILDTSAGNPINTVLNILFIILSVFTGLAGILAVIRVIDGKELQVRKVYKESFSKFWTFFLLTIVICLIYLLGLVLLIIPFVIVVTWFAFSRFIMVEKGQGIKTSLVGSKNIVKGIFWKVLGRMIVFGLFWLLAQIVFSVLPFGTGTIAFSLCGALFVIPQFLLYRETASEKAVSG